MKPIYKYLAHAGLSAAMCMMMVLPSMAQRGGGGHSGGGGGGGFHGGGGGGGHVSGGFSGGRTGGSFSSGRPGGSFSGGRTGMVSRGNFSGGRTGMASRGNFSGRPMVGTRGSFGMRSGAIAPKGYVRSVTATGGVRGLANRGYVGRGGVYGHGYAGGGVYARPYVWGQHGGYFYSHGYYGSMYYPWLGFSCGFLPYGYYPFFWDDASYYYDDGLFYQYDNDQYTVVEPPVGAEVDKLPAKAESIVIDGQEYYEYNGVYYQAVTKDNGQVVYEVAGKDGVLNTGTTGADAVIPKVGDMTYDLPADCKKVKLNGQTLYVSDDGIYYQETKDNDGKKAYKIVALESNDGQ